MFKRHVKFYLLTISFSLSITSFSFAMQGEEEKKGANIRVASTVGWNTEARDGSVVVTGHNNKIIHLDMSREQNEVKEDKNGVHVFVPDVLKIVSASYGAPGWIRNGYQRVEPFVEPTFSGKRSGSILVSNNTLGGDPAKGYAKSLEIFYQCMRGDQGSKIMKTRAKEGETLNLTCFNNKEKDYD